MLPISRYFRWRSRIARSGYQDLVSNNNALLAVMKRKGLWQTYYWPAHSQTLQVGKNVAQWYNGYDQLLNPAIDLFNDAVLRAQAGRRPDHPLDAGDPQQRGRGSTDGCVRQLHRRPPNARSKMPWTPALYGDGTANGGKQITGLATAVPDLPNTGVYGGIDRGDCHAIWRTTTFDPHGTAGTVTWRRSARRSTRPRSGRCSTTS